MRAGDGGRVSGPHDALERVMRTRRRRTSEAPLRLLVGAWLVTAIFVSGSSRRRADRRGGKVSRAEEGAAMRLSLGVVGSGLWLSTLAFVVKPGLLAGTRMPLPRPLRFAGAALAFACLPVVFGVFGALGENVTPTVVTREEHTLVTHGPYRFVRHPLYTFGALAFFGLSLAAASWLMAVLGVAGFALLATRTKKEEAALFERFGDRYRAYADRTGRFVPRAGRRPAGTPPIGG